VDFVGKVLALACAVLWAVAVILFKKAGDTIRPLALNWYKTALTAVLLLPFLLAEGLGGITGLSLLKVLLSGILGIAVSDTLFFIALDRLGASLTAIVDCFYAPSAMLAAWAMLGELPRMVQVAGACCVISAVLVVSLERDHVRAKLDRRRLATGFLAGAAAMGVMGISITLMKPILEQRSLWLVTELRALAALAVLSVMMLLRRDRRALFASLGGHGAWRHALPGSFLGNVLAMTLWVAAFKYTSVNSAAILNQTNIVFVVIMATWLLKEPFSRHRLLGTALAFTGAVMILVV
jgi:drug/metabolite transporter (DMT)-like permease